MPHFFFVNKFGPESQKCLFRDLGHLWLRGVRLLTIFGPIRLDNMLDTHHIANQRVPEIKDEMDKNTNRIQHMYSILPRRYYKTYLNKIYHNRHL